jgi:hypothetical protein
VSKSNLDESDGQIFLQRISPGIRLIIRLISGIYLPPLFEDHPHHFSLAARDSNLKRLAHSELTEEGIADSPPDIVIQSPTIRKSADQFPTVSGKPQYFFRS